MNTKISMEFINIILKGIILCLVEAGDLKKGTLEKI